MITFQLTGWVDWNQFGLGRVIDRWANDIKDESIAVSCSLCLPVAAGTATLHAGKKTSSSILCWPPGFWLETSASAHYWTEFVDSEPEGHSSQLIKTGSHTRSQLCITTHPVDNPPQWLQSLNIFSSSNKESCCFDFASYYFKWLEMRRQRRSCWGN